MADYTDTKSFGTKVYPVEANIVTPLFERIEPILTHKQLLKRYLKGIEGLDYDKEELNDEIIRAMNEVELMTNLSLTKRQQRQRVPFDRDLYQAMVYMKLNEGPILSLEEIVIESSNGESIYRLPPSWIEMGYAHKRQINLIPILSIFGAAGLQDGQPSNAGLIFIQAVNNFQWVPGFFTVSYTIGVCHKDGQLPRVLNELVGMVAAIEILSNMQTRNIHTSTSISQDGISQAATNAGPQIYQPRIDALTAKKDKMMEKIKAEFHQKYFLSNI